MTADSRPAALVEQLERTWASLLTLGRQLDADEWTRPTGCPGWRVADQYAHVLGTESGLAGRSSPPEPAVVGPHARNDIGRWNERWISAWQARSQADLLEELQAVTTARLASLRAMTDEEFEATSATPIGPAPYRRFMQIRVFDCWVHEQDVRRAVGRPGHEDGPAAEQSVDEVERAIGFIVAKRAGAPAGSRVAIELTGPLRRRILVAVDGRAAVVAELDGPATTTLRCGSTMFVALACGRTDATPEEVTVEGDEALGRRIAQHLGFTI